MVRRFRSRSPGASSRTCRPITEGAELPLIYSKRTETMARKRISRRTFVGNVGAGLAFTIVPRHVLGRGIRAPSDTLNIACIGVGGRGREDVRGVSIENIYALCDVDDVSAADSYATYPKAKRYKDFREMLDKEAKRIDAVTVATPDHTHRSEERRVGKECRSPWSPYREKKKCSAELRARRSPD